MALQLVLKLWYPCFQSSKTTKFLPGKHVSNTSNPPTWKARAYAFVWHITQNWCSMGGPNSSYAAGSIACKFPDAYNLSHMAK